MNTRGSIGRWVLAAGTLTLAGCQAVFGFEDFSSGADADDAGAGGTNSAGGTAGTGGGGGGGSGGASGAGGGAGTASGGGGTGGSGPACPAGAAPGEHGPPMVQVHAIGGACFWMDATEVTRAQYAEFLEDPRVPAQEAVCSWNVGDAGSGAYAPGPGCSPSFDASGADGDLPITCIDWCDASAFCKWAGKDLCADSAASPKLVTQSDWYAGCTTGTDGRTYSCDNTCVAAICNGSAYGKGAPETVGSIQDCSVTGTDGTAKVYDLSGNVAEWTGACAGNPGTCQARGGSYASGDSAIQCGATQQYSRQALEPTIGFRCCVHP